MIVKAAAPIDTGCSTIDGNTYCAASIKGVNTLFSNVLTVALEIAAVILFIMVVVSGYKFMTSGGDPKAAETAKKSLTYAILGMVLVASAFLILQLIEDFTGAPVTEFNVIAP